MHPTERRSDTHRKWIGIGRDAVNTEMIFFRELTENKTGR